MIEGEDDAGCVFKFLQSHFTHHVQEKHQGSKLYSFKRTGHAVFRVRNQGFIDAIKQFLSPFQNRIANQPNEMAD